MVASLLGSLNIGDPDGTIPTVSIAGGNELNDIITAQGDYGVLRYNTQDNTYTYTLDPVTESTAAALATGAVQENVYLHRVRRQSDRERHLVYRHLSHRA